MIDEKEVKKWLAIVEKSCSSSEESGEKHGEELFEHRDELVAFLYELNEFVSQKSTARAVLQEIPSVGKCLGALTQNYIVQSSEKAVKLLFQVVISLASHEGTDSTTRKMIAWAQSQIKQMACPSPACPASFLLIGHSIGNTATELTQTMTDKLVLSICHDLLKDNGTKWNPSINDLVPSLIHHGLALRKLSEMCLPIITEPIAKPLVESLLLAGNSCTDIITSTCDHFVAEDCLSPRFLDFVAEMTRQTELDPNTKGCGYKEVLRHDALVALWRRYQPSFETQVLDILEFAVVRHPELSIQKVKQLMLACHLAKACADHVQLYETAVQLVYCFMYNVPSNSRLQDVLRAFREVKHTDKDSITRTNYAH